jgi:cyclopropane-fatty-acyl-phospholipid synthase
MESLREHYQLTLGQWLRRLDERRDEAVALVGERTYRAWRLYLAASAWRFQSGRIGLAQILLARQSSSGQVDLPRTRADLYMMEQPVERAVGA